MAKTYCHSLHSSFFSISSTKPSHHFKSSKSNTQLTVTSSLTMDEIHKQGRSKFIEFPFVTSPHRQLMADLVSTVEDKLGSQLLPCSLPLDVQHCQNESGTAQASLHIRSAHHQSSAVDFILGSWLHCKLPTGAALNITSLSGYLNLTTDAPNFLIELIQSSPTSLVVILDLPPRKDLVLYPDYLQTFYENSELETHRQTIYKLKEVQPYVTSALYLRSLLSPTAIMVRVDTESGEAWQMEEIIKNHIDPVAKEVLGIWLDNCACGGREFGDEEKAILKKRDELIKKKTIEIDLGSNFPRLFGPEMTDRVLGAICEVYNV